MKNVGQIIIPLSLLIIAPLVQTAYADGLEPLSVLDADIFKKGARFWSLTTGKSVDHRLGRIILVQFSVNNYLYDHVAVDYGFTFGHAKAKQTRDGVQGGPELGIRWHFANAGRWSTYIKSSVAAVFHERPLAKDTLRFNFDLQAGLGATYRLNKETALMGGFGWHHLSNAHILGQKHNFGYDGPMLYIGLMRPF